MLHKSILQVALKCSELDTTNCLGPFLTLGSKVLVAIPNGVLLHHKCQLYLPCLPICFLAQPIKTFACFLVHLCQAGSWCVRHLLWSVESIDESEDAQEEEHSRLFPEVKGFESLSLSLSLKKDLFVFHCNTCSYQ